MELLDVNQKDSAHLAHLFGCLASRPALANISHKRMPTWYEHCVFVKSEPYDFWWIIVSDDGEWVGTCYLTDRSEIGITILPIHRSHGYGAASIVKVKDTTRRDVYYANIAEGNDGSYRFFQRLGFKKCQYTLKLDTTAPSSSSGSSPATTAGA